METKKPVCSAENPWDSDQSFYRDDFEHPDVVKQYTFELEGDDEFPTRTITIVECIHCHWRFAQ
jgi:hypothetical protein